MNNQKNFLPAQMMFEDLSIPRIMEHAAEIHPDAGVFSPTVGDTTAGMNYKDVLERIKRLANALLDLGIGPGDRIATLAWNDRRHFELYYAISGIGAVCHTINPRLPFSQIMWIVRDAQDCALFYDPGFHETATSLQRASPSLQNIIALGDITQSGSLNYEDLIANASNIHTWSIIPEQSACSLCYTSGTTGNPKGAMYSHRSTLLQSFSVIIGAASCFGAGKRILPIVPLFHVNAWGLPYTAPLSGSSLIMPGQKLDGTSLFNLMEAGGATSSWGVPTVFAGLLEEMRKRKQAPAQLEQVLIGGSATPSAMITEFQQDFGIEVLQGWGMTELSPVGSVTPSFAEFANDTACEAKLSAGRRLFSLKMRIQDDSNKILDHDGVQIGNLAVSGHSAISAYYGQDKNAEQFTSDGWLLTGDVARITENGDLFIVDRTKDLIKSGGEWISSIDLENAALSMPGIRQAAAIAVPHPRWGERPLLVLVCEDDQKIDTDKLRGHLNKTLAKWQIPDEIEFAQSLPLNATGKVSKLELRAIYSKAM